MEINNTDEIENLLLPISINADSIGGLLENEAENKNDDSVLTSDLDKQEIACLNSTTDNDDHSSSSDDLVLQIICKDDDSPIHSDDLSLQISSDSSNEMFSLSTLDDSLSSYLIRTPGRVDASKSSSNTNNNKDSDFSPEYIDETPEIASTPFSKTPSVPSVRKSVIAKSLFQLSKTSNTSHTDDDEGDSSNFDLEMSFNEINSQGVEEIIYNECEQEEETEVIKVKEGRRDITKVQLPYDSGHVISIHFAENGQSTDVRFSIDPAQSTGSESSERDAASSASAAQENLEETNSTTMRGIPEGREETEWDPMDWSSTIKSVKHMGEEKSATATAWAFKNPSVEKQVSDKKKEWTFEMNSPEKIHDQNKWKFNLPGIVYQKEIGTQTEGCVESKGGEVEIRRKEKHLWKMRKQAKTRRGEDNWRVETNRMKMHDEEGDRCCCSTQ